MADPHAPLLPPRLRRGDRTRAQLAEAALAEFANVGVERASISRIAERAGVSRSLFYFHFPAKTHVLLELQRSLEVPIAERISSSAGLREALEAFVDGLIRAMRTVGDPEIFAEMLRVYSRSPGDPPLEEQPFPVVYALGRQFAEGARRSELKAGLDAAHATHLLLTSIFGYLISTRASEGECRADLEILTSLYLRERATQ